MPNEYNSELLPSKDIVERLKAKPPKGFVTSPLMIEAATEIERLREALERAADSLHDYHAIDEWAEACEALGEKE
jgi:hypothetical protein